MPDSEKHGRPAGWSAGGSAGVRTVVAVGLLSGASIAYEILLVRLFSIVDWHHLAYLVISLALLGYGASGTLLALTREALLKHFPAATATSAALFGLTSIGAFLIAQRINFNSLEIIWSRRQLGILFLLYLLFAVPFLCAATCIGLTLTRFGAHAARIYRADLLGAGCSSAALMALLFVAHPVTCQQIAGAAGLVSSSLFLLQHERPRRLTAALALLAGITVVIAARPLLLPLRISQFKELSQALRIPGARVIEERSGPLALLSVVESPVVPFRFAPGLSLGYAPEIPQQIALFSDATGMSPITRYRGDPASVAHLDFVTSAAPYHLRDRLHHAVIIGAGGGAEVLSALAHDVEPVTAVELNPQVVGLVAHDFREYSGNIYNDRRVRVEIREARRFISESSDRYGLIQISLVDSFGASAAGVQAVSESYLYTVEALVEMLEHLEPGGYLVITRWMQVPPREIVKLFATAVVALEKLGMQTARSLALIRSWNTATLIVKKGAFDRREIAALRRFCDERSFDLDYAPGIARVDTNRFNVLDHSYLFDAASALVAGGRAREEFFDRYKFFVRPATDERPYFFHFFKWRVLPELLRLRGRAGIPLIEWGYLVLIAALAQALIAAAALILLPLFWLRRASDAPHHDSRLRLIAYFGSIGLAFLFIEIAFIQRLTLFLGHPLYAVMVVLASFLLFAGIGSGASGHIHPARAKLIPLVVAIAALIDLVLVRTISSVALGMGAPLKVVISVALVAPLALLMGMPMPLGLRRLAATDPAAIPWAWGINGTASVLSSICATLVAVHFGLSAVVAGAALLYAIASGSAGSSPDP